jgi:hypothetical protein
MDSARLASFKGISYLDTSIFFSILPYFSIVFIKILFFITRGGNNMALPSLVLASTKLVIGKSLSEFFLGTALGAGCPRVLKWLYEQLFGTDSTLFPLIANQMSQDFRLLSQYLENFIRENEKIKDILAKSVGKGKTCQHQIELTLHQFQDISIFMRQSGQEIQQCRDHLLQNKRTCTQLKERFSSLSEQLPPNLKELTDENRLLRRELDICKHQIEFLCKWSVTNTQESLEVGSAKHLKH